MTERRGTKALELWCRRITDGYPGVNVQNMTTSWRDGLAFCAMIHHFRPDLIDFNSLNKDDVYGNNELAFRTAAEHLGIPALLDAEDMASCSVPDRLSILTYLSQFYQNFGGSSPSRLALSRTKESSKEGITPVSPTTPTKPKMGPRMGMRREPCAVCGMPVFLAEKLMISRTPYHRTCFRCARCNNQLTPGNYYETEEGQYCCETCPDEEQTKSPSKPILHQAYNDAVVLGHEDNSEKNANFTSGYQRSLSDEEKTERILERVPQSPASLITAEEIRRESLVAENISHSAQMRLNFMTTNLLSENRDEESDNSLSNDEDYSLDVDGAEEDEAGSRAESSPPGGSLRNSRSPTGSPSVKKKNGDGRVDAGKMPFEVMDDRDSISVEPNVDITRSSGSIARDEINESDYLDDRLEFNEDDDKTKKSFDTATNEATHVSHRNSYLEDKDALLDRQDTKDTLGPDIDLDTAKRRETIEDTSQCLSLVQRRLKIFENSEIQQSKFSSLSKNLERKSLTVDSIDTEIREEISQDDIDLSGKEEMKINEEIDRSLKIEEEKSSDEMLDTSVSEDKLERILPPIVPKRAALEFRKAEKLKSKNSETTVLNASGIDLSAEEIYPEDLNPFKSDEDEEEEKKVGGNLENSRSSKVSTNPFGSSSDEEEDERPKAPPRPAARSTVAGNKWKEATKDEIDKEAPTKRRLKAPQINLNPFWSDDDEDHESEDECRGHSLTANTPIPKPRSIKQTPDSFLSQRKTDLHRGDIYASNSSLGSTGSAPTPGGTYRKKKPAPPPPIVSELFASGADSLLSPNRRSNTLTGSNNSLRTTPRARKAKPAPPPPMPTSTPCSANIIANLTLTESPITTDSVKIIENRDYEMWDDRKVGKDEANRNKQSMTTMSSDETNPYGGYTDKSVQGKWKRKKGPAPARPIPHRRKIKVMSLKDVKLELDEIEVQQQGLEKQGVRLEQLIRDKAETGNATEETSLEMDVEELVLELFALVNEKNELFRRQAELMLLRRQQRLEEEHADIEYQIRCLLCQPEATKTDFDKQREETLIQRLVEIVERRNEIVECLEMDRRREVEEDRSINTRMGLYAAKNKGDFAKELEEDENNRSRKSKKTKLKEKAKEKILRKVHKKDADKDVDETEVKLKRQNKRKWF